MGLFYNVSDKTQISPKLKNPNCDKTQNSRAQIVTNIKNSYNDKTKKIKCEEKEKKSYCEKTQNPKCEREKNQSVTKPKKKKSFSQNIMTH